MNKNFASFFILSAWLFISNSCISDKSNSIITEQWKELELTFHARAAYDNPYTDVDLHVEFIHNSGEKLIRPDSGMVKIPGKSGLPARWIPANGHGNHTRQIRMMQD